MKKSLIYLSVVTLSLAVVFTACKKDAASKSDNSAEVATTADDQSRFSTESDAAFNDANLAIETSPSVTGREEGVQGLICDAAVSIDSVAGVRSITITYNGTNCSLTRTRTGKVVISIPAGVHWKNAGAMVTIDFQNLKITRLIDNKSITLNGTHTYTNVSGGLLINLPTLQSITHTVSSSNMSVTFDDGSKRTWQVARQHVFTYPSGVVITITGTHTEGSVTNVAEWGTNRFGNAFTTSITEPLVIKQDCNGRLTGGQIKHVTSNVSATITYGLDANGNATGCPGLGVYYFKAVWTGANGNSIGIILPY